MYEQLSESGTLEEKATTHTIAFGDSEGGSLRGRVFSEHTVEQFL